MLGKEIKTKCKKCGKSLDPEALLCDRICKSCRIKEKEELKKISVPKGVYYLSTTIMALAYLVTLNTNYLLAFLIGLLCGKHCYKLAVRNGSKGYMAYYIGFFFNLIGLAVCELYYGHKEKSKLTKKILDK